MAQQIGEAPAPDPKFQPHVPPGESRPEFTLRAVLLGGIFGLIFGTVTVYVGLRSSLTIAASIPIAVLSSSILSVFGKASILENNIVQTTGSVGQSVAGGVIFTIPALIFLGFPLEYSRVFLLAWIGGWLGVFFMSPLRRPLVIQEHGKLPYPEGTPCANVLIAGEQSGSVAGPAFTGLGLGSLYTLFQNKNLFGLWPSTANYEPSWYLGSAIRADTAAEFLGVGYIMRPQIAGPLLAGGVFAWLVVMPAISFFGGSLTSGLLPAQKLISKMGVLEIHDAYIRPMGAGAVAAACVITLIKTIPTIVRALRAGAVNLKKGDATVAGSSRTDRELSMKYGLAGTVLVLLMMLAMFIWRPLPGASTSILANIASVAFVVIFGFLFVTVSSRIAGLIGTSANPTSAMALATMMATCVMFLWTGPKTSAYEALVISIGAVVGIASANGGNTSQNLKTGFLVGATPSRQQWALVIGVPISVFAIAGTLGLMNKGLEQIQQVDFKKQVNLNLEEGIRQVPPEQNPLRERADIKIVDKEGKFIMRVSPENYSLVTAFGAKDLEDGQYLCDAAGNVKFRWIQGIGSDQAPAPQAKLMATVVNGMMIRHLRWNLVLVGVFIVIGVEILGARSLLFAAGFYIPIAITLSIFCGGIVRWLVDRAATKAGEKQGVRGASPGELYGAGLIAAGGVVGLLGIVIKLVETAPGSKWYHIEPGVLSLGKHVPIIGKSSMISALMFILLAFSTYYFARKPLTSDRKRS